MKKTFKLFGLILMAMLLFNQTSYADAVAKKRNKCKNGKQYYAKAKADGPGWGCKKDKEKNWSCSTASADAYIYYYSNCACTKDGGPGAQDGAKAYASAGTVLTQSTWKTTACSGFKAGGDLPANFISTPTGFNGFVSNEVSAEDVVFDYAKNTITFRALSGNIQANADQLADEYSTFIITIAKISGDDGQEREVVLFRKQVTLTGGKLTVTGSEGGFRESDFKPSLLEKGSRYELPKSDRVVQLGEDIDENTVLEVSFEGDVKNLKDELSSPNGTPSTICCEKNLLKNGALTGDCSAYTSNNITSGCLPNWSRSTGSPQLSNAMGYTTPGFVLAWGTNTPNETIKQSVTLQAGYRYRISCAIRKPKPLAGHIDGMRFQFYAGSIAPTNLMGQTFKLFYTATPDWVYVTLPDWTCPPGLAGVKDMIIGAISETAGKAAFGYIDDICIQELPPCDRLLAAAISGPVTLCEGTGASYSLPALPGATYSWSVSPSVPFTGNNTNAITIPGTSTVGKTQLTISVKVKCGETEVVKTLVVNILKKITDANFNLVVSQGTGGYSASATPVVGAGYQHIWVLYESSTPFPNCNLTTTGFLTKDIQYGINYSFSGLTTGKNYLLRHYVQNCDGAWLVKNKCFSVTREARIKPGTNELPATMSDGALKTLSNDEVEIEIIKAEISQAGTSTGTPKDK
ncbi:MAG: hypothetical protein HUU01_11345 [Saprospiraceae bacterium]|nr:hypothetical protein [Saprospiraceae bacterium]